MFSLNLVFSYPLVLYPAHVLLENYLYAGWPKSRKRQCSKNLNRTLLVAFTVAVTLLLDDKLGAFLSINGAVTCTPITFGIPALFHYKKVAETTCQKVVDLSVVAISVFIFVFCTYEGVTNWNN